jgi:hypothetical protein
MDMGHLIDKVTAIEQLQARIAALEQRLAQLEPSQPTRYRDVTAKCFDTSLKQNGSEYSADDTGEWAVKVQVEAGYRLRKVQLYRCKTESLFSCTFPPQYDLVDAFIIEKEEPELGHKERP